MVAIKRSASCFTLMLATLLLSATAQAQPVTDGLLAYYPFDGDAQDASGAQQHGILHGATLCKDRDGRAESAYHFDGSDYIATPLSIDDACGTVSAWVYVDSYQTGYDRLNLILGQWDSLQLGLGDSSLGADGKWVFRWRNSEGTMINAIGPSASLHIWVHVAGVWDGSAITLYLDGQALATEPAGIPAAASGTLVIGRHSHLFGQSYWFGCIDDVCIFDRALSPEEIALLAGTESSSDNHSLSKVKQGYQD